MAPNLLKNVHIINELLGTDISSQELKDELTVLKTGIVTSLKKVAPLVVDRWQKAQPPNWGPGLPQESRSHVPLPSGPPVPSSDPQTSQDTPAETAKKRKRTIPKKLHLPHMWQCFIL